MGKKVIIAHDDLDLNYLDTAAGGWSVKTAGDGNEALRLIQRFRGAVVAAVIDLDSPNDEGLAILRRLRMAYPDLPVVALARNDKPTEAAEALGAGATECAYKPIIHEELVRILQRVTHSETACREETVDAGAGQSDFVHLNSEMRTIQQSLRMLAPWNVPVIFIGETGAGKEVAARELHRLSPRANKPFIKINCAAVPSELLESELFGYEKGAFTGALRSKPGKFELADSGTVLLDEIGDMHSNLQAKLLQVLQDGEFDRLGGRQSMHVDVRVLAATHRDLRRAVETGAFREDLFYRLNVATVVIPPLRDRKDEIIPLAEKFVIKHGASSGMELPEIPALLRQALTDYPWPGNVRELENVVRKFLVFRQPEALAAELWKRIGERRHSVVSAQAARMAPRSAPAAGTARNGLNGLEIVKSLSHGNGQTNGHSNGHANGHANGHSNGHNNGYSNGHANGHSNGFSIGAAGSDAAKYVEAAASHPDEVLEQLHRPTGHSASPEPEYEFLAASDEEAAEQLVDDPMASVPGSLSGYASDDLDHAQQNGGLRNRSLELEDHGGNFKNGEQLSTLAQVEELSKEFERRTILVALQRSTWNRKKAAKMLDIDYKGLLYKMKKLEIA
jgi:two-component system response regulator AtoC